jgi:hypothetical protein
MKYGQPRGPWVDVNRPKTALPGSAGDAASTPPPFAVVTQLIALGTWANAFLRKGFEASPLNRDHSTLKMCNKVAFADLRGLLRVREVPVAADPLTWLRWLREEGCQSAHVLWFPRPPQEGPADRKAPELQEPGWVLECRCAEGADRWRARWDLTNRYAAQNRSWSVVYTRLARNVEPTPPTQAEPAVLRDGLASAIAKCAAFAAEHKQAAWSQCLSRAQELLESPKPFDATPHADLLPRVGGTVAARQILAACSQILTHPPKAENLPAESDPERVRSQLDQLAGQLQTEVVQSIEAAVNTWAQGD